jgi:hypothetical protein
MRKLSKAGLKGQMEEKTRKQERFLQHPSEISKKSDSRPKSYVQLFRPYDRHVKLP